MIITNIKTASGKTTKQYVKHSYIDVSSQQVYNS